MTASHDAQAKLKQLGIELPAAGAPAAAYVMAAQTGNQVFLSGHIAKKDGKPWVGKLGADMTTEQGKAAARASGKKVREPISGCWPTYMPSCPGSPWLKPPSPPPRCACRASGMPPDWAIPGPALQTRAERATAKGRKNATRAAMRRTCEKRAQTLVFICLLASSTAVI